MVYCSVGYGELAPTSWIGRSLTSIMFISCTVVLAFPISVICILFEHYYTKKINAKWKNAHAALNLRGMSEEQMLDLFKEMDVDGSGVSS